MSEPTSERQAVAANALDEEQLNDFVVITGFSGAGKSTAMDVFEDAGYFCVDNLPPGMIGSLADLFMHEGSRVEYAAIVCDVRGGSYFTELDQKLDLLDSAGVNYRVLYLEADEQTLVNRYKETRRRHPLAPDSGSISDGIALERELLEPLRRRADFVIDTTGVNVWSLRRKITSEMLAHPDGSQLAVRFESFGFKNGPHRDADLVLDVRFLPNPHYDAELKPRTGRDQAVVDYINAEGDLDAFLERLEPLLDYLLPAYANEGKSHLLVAVGCTGGRHRSVALAEHLGKQYSGREHLRVEVAHRDLQDQPQS